MDIWKRERPAFKLPNNDTRPSVFASKSAEKNKHSHFSALKLICCISIIILSFAISGCMFGTKSNTGMAFPMVSIRGTFENVAEITLIVSGSDMDTIEETYPAPPGSIEIEVPSGANRDFELLVYVTGESGFPAYQGTASADLTPGDAQDIVIALDFVRDKIYIANWASDSVSVIDGARNTVMETDPMGVAVNSITNRIYIANSGSDSVTVIDGSTDTVVTTVTVGTTPYLLDVMP